MNEARNGVSRHCLPAPRGPGRGDAVSVVGNRCLVAVHPVVELQGIDVVLLGEVVDGPLLVRPAHALGVGVQEPEAQVAIWVGGHVQRSLTLRAVVRVGFDDVAGVVTVGGAELPRCAPVSIDGPIVRGHDLFAQVHEAESNVGGAGDLGGHIDALVGQVSSVFCPDACDLRLGMRRRHHPDDSGSGRRCRRDDRYFRG